MPPSYPHENSFPVWSKIVLVCVVVVFFGGGAWFFQAQQKQQRQAVEENLWSIANLKSQQISEWREERIADGLVLMNRRELVASVQRYLSGANGRELSEIMRRLQPIRDRYHFTDIFVADPQKRIRLRMEQDGTAIEEGKGFHSAMDEAVAARIPVWTPLHTGGAFPAPHLAVVVPLFSDNTEGSLVGALVLINDASQFLYPILDLWPIHSHTAETLLVQKEGDDVLFLNELRHREGTVLTFRLPAGRTDLPAAMAVAGRQGVVEGRDYRGERVVAAILPIPNSPWFLVSKMDSDEAFAEWRFRSIMILVFLFSGLGLVVAVWFLVGLRSQKIYFQCLYRSEAELSQVLAKYRLLADNTLDIIWAMNGDLEFTYVNSVIKERMGYEPEEWIGTNLRKHCRNDQFVKITDTVASEVEKGEKHQGVTFEAEMLKKDGTSILLEMHTLVFIDENGNLAGLQGTSRDITERVEREKAMEVLREELAEARKMEAVGRLAGGVAHDYNNMLNIIIGYAELGMEGLGPEHPLRPDLSQIMNAAQRSAAITRKLLAVASKQMIAADIIDLNRQLESMAGKLKQQLGDSVDLVWLPGSQLWPVKMDLSQLGQVLSNLCANARDAIDGEGRVTIATENVSLDTAFCSVHPGSVPGDFVMLSVSDDGKGMDKETLENVFEPFFTTRRFGESAGLGLAVVYGIVKQNRGFLDVSSEPEKGTVFRIYLPSQKGVKKS